MSIKSLLFPEDFTGTNPNNRLTNYPVKLGVNTARVIVLPHGPFFADTLTLSVVGKSEPLKLKDDYSLLYMDEHLTRLAGGRPVVSIVYVKEHVPVDLTLTCQLVGGGYVSDIHVIQSLLDDLNNDNRNVYWDHILNDPDRFPATSHLHDLGDSQGYLFLVEILASIRDQFIANSPKLYDRLNDQLTKTKAGLLERLTRHRLDKGNPHRTTAHQIGSYYSHEIAAFWSLLNKEIDDFEPIFKDLLNKIDELELKVANHLTTISGYSAQLSVIEAIINSIRSDIHDANQAVNALEARRLDLTNRMSTIESASTTIERDADYNTADLDVLDTTNSSHLASISDLANKDKVKYSTINSYSASIQTAIDGKAGFAQTYFNLTQRLMSDTANYAADIDGLVDKIKEFEEWKANHIAHHNAIQNSIDLGNSRLNNYWEDIVDLPTSTDEVTMHVRKGTNSIDNLVPGRGYLVFIWGSWPEKGNQANNLGAMSIYGSDGQNIESIPARSIDWFDGGAYGGVVMYVTAPADGKVFGVIDQGRSSANCTRMTALGIGPGTNSPV